VSEKYPAITIPTGSLNALTRSAQSLKEMVEMLIGLRGTGVLRAWTLGEANKTKQAPLPLMGYEIAALPAAKDYPQCVVYVINGASNKRLAVSDGIAWRYMDGLAV
jgi:hypothetical protein